VDRLALLQRLARRTPSRIVLLVLDGVGDLRTEEQPKTALDLARLPNLDALAERSALGRLVPVRPGITPGSGPGHLALFGYDPTTDEADIGRGVLEALGLELDLLRGDLTARGNFASADAEGRLTDRRAGRPSNEEGRRLCGLLSEAVAGVDSDLDIAIHAGEGHRFVLLVRGDDLSTAIDDTDPQRLGVPPRELEASDPAAESTVRRLAPVVSAMTAAVAGEPAANRVLLRGFSTLPSLPSFAELYGLRACAFAGYPLYRGVASACGMEVVPCGKQPEDLIAAVRESWNRFDFFFLHVKQADQAGEDGNLERKAEVLESVDRIVADLLALEPEVLAITGDHSTPAPMKAHSWHPVPLLLHAATAFVDGSTEWSEAASAGGALGTLPACDLLALLLAHAGKLAKYGA
jgi:2,3-bisphosphoglycerate-independent phosphoglycerate mutase